MPLASLTAYGAQHGVSKQAAAKWKRDGLLVLAGDQVDVEASDRKLKGAGKGRFSRKRGGAGPRAPAKPKAAPRPRALPEPDDEDDDGFGPPLDEAELQELSEFEAGIKEGRFVSQAQADRIKGNALALRQLIMARKLAGALVEIDVAEAALFEAARSSRDAWLNFPARAGPMIAADLGVEAEKAVEVLTAHVHDLLVQLGEPDVRFGEADACGEAGAGVA